MSSRSVCHRSRKRGNDPTANSEGSHHSIERIIRWPVFAYFCVLSNKKSSMQTLQRGQKHAVWSAIYGLCLSTGCRLMTHATIQESDENVPMADPKEAVTWSKQSNVDHWKVRRRQRFAFCCRLKKQIPNMQPCQPSYISYICSALPCARCENCLHAIMWTCSRRDGCSFWVHATVPPLEKATEMFRQQFRRKPSLLHNLKHCSCAGFYCGIRTTCRTRF